MGLIRDIAGAFIPGIPGDSRKRTSNTSPTDSQDQDQSTAGGSTFGESFGRKVLRGVERSMKRRYGQRDGYNGRG